MGEIIEFEISWYRLIIMFEDAGGFFLFWSAIVMIYIL